MISMADIKGEPIPFDEGFGQRSKMSQACLEVDMEISWFLVCSFVGFSFLFVALIIDNIEAILLNSQLQNEKFEL